jgi:hypothetical protein
MVHFTFSTLVSGSYYYYCLYSLLPVHINYEGQQVFFYVAKYCQIMKYYGEECTLGPKNIICNAKIWGL